MQLVNSINTTGYKYVIETIWVPRVGNEFITSYINTSQSLFVDIWNCQELLSSMHIKQLANNMYSPTQI